MKKKIENWFYKNTDPMIRGWLYLSLLGIIVLLIIFFGIRAWFS